MSIQVTVRKSNSTNSKAPVAYADALINSNGFKFHVKGIKIWQNKDSRKVQMPGKSNPVGNKTYYNEYFKYDSTEDQKLLDKEVLTSYQVLIGEVENVSA